jgi:spore germination protein KC
VKRGLIIALIIVVTITVSGCWSRHELDTLAIIEVVGIDKAKDDGKISIAVQILKPAELGGQAVGGMSSNQGVWTVTSTGYTVFDAFRNATMQSGRQLFLSHNKIIVIGEEMARSGISPLIDFFNRNAETRHLSWLIIAKGEAGDIVLAEHEQENPPARAIENLVKSSGVTSMAAAVNLHEFLLMLNSKTTDPVASRIEAFEKEGADKEETPEGTMSEEGKEGKPKKTVRLTGAAVFKHDKLVGWLNRPETRGLNWILGKARSGSIIVRSPVDETKYVSLEIIKASRKIIPEIQDGKVVITAEIAVVGNLTEQMSEVALTKPELFRSLERRQAEVIKNEIDLVLRKAQQEWGVDIFGFGEAVQRKFPKEWKELKDGWRKKFPQVEVNVKVTAKLREVGISDAPAETK